jgi:hypothetical protein
MGKPTRIIPVWNSFALLTALFGMLTAQGCGGGFLFSFQGAQLRKGHEIPIAESVPHTRSSQTRDLTVTYTCAVENDRFRVAGRVCFASHLTWNFVGLRYFNLSVVVVDANNTIIANHSLVSAGCFDNICDVTFDSKLKLPQASSASSFAFIYTGEAGVGGDGGRASACNFWDCPIYR